MRAESDIELIRPNLTWDESNMLMLLLSRWLVVARHDHGPDYVPQQLNIGVNNILCSPLNTYDYPMKQICP